MRVNVDLKEADIVDDAVAVVRAAGAEGSVTYISFLPEVWQRLDELAPGSPMIHLVDSAASLASLAMGDAGSQGVAAGEAEIAVSNTYYYVNLMRSKKPEDREVAAKLGVVFPNQANRGTHVNISGGAVARYAPNKAVAVKFLEYLVSPQAQRYFAEGNSEYPVVAGVELSAELKSLGTFKEDQLNARVFAQNNAEALKIMDRAGWK